MPPAASHSNQFHEGSFVAGDLMTRGAATLGEAAGRRGSTVVSITTSPGCKSAYAESYVLLASPLTAAGAASNTASTGAVLAGSSATLASIVSAPSYTLVSTLVSVTATVVTGGSAAACSLSPDVNDSGVISSPASDGISSKLPALSLFGSLLMNASAFATNMTFIAADSPTWRSCSRCAIRDSESPGCTRYCTPCSIAVSVAGARRSIATVCVVAGATAGCAAVAGCSAAATAVCMSTGSTNIV